jgi:large subunit ribosomal protein L14e
MSGEIFNKHVEVGRVCRVNFGPEEGKLCVVADLVNLKRVVVDGEELERQVMPVRRLTLTDLKLPIRWGSRTGVIRKHITKANLKGQFAKTALGQKLAKLQRRSELNDFDRFKVMLLKKKLARIVRNKKLCAEKKAAPAPKGKKEGKKK